VTFAAIRGDRLHRDQHAAGVVEFDLVELDKLRTAIRPTERAGGTSCKVGMNGLRVRG